MTYIKSEYRKLGLSAKQVLGLDKPKNPKRDPYGKQGKKKTLDF